MTAAVAGTPKHMPGRLINVVHVRPSTSPTSSIPGWIGPRSIVSGAAMAGACGDWKGLTGSRGRAGTSAVLAPPAGPPWAVGAAGIITTAPHCGHLACRPAVPSPVRKSFPQLVQRNSIGMGPSLQVLTKITQVGSAWQGEFARISPD